MLRNLPSRLTHGHIFVTTVSTCLIPLLPLLSSIRLQNNIHPLDELPDELLVLIFEWLAVLNSAPNIALLRVCKRVRVVALDTPNLWSTITLYGLKPLAGLEPLLALVGPTIPLSLDIDVAGEASYPGTACSPARCNQIGLALKKEMPRVRSLTMRYHPHQRAHFETLLQSAAPQLEAVTLMCGGTISLTDLTAPRLRNVEVDRMQLGRSVLPPGSDVRTVVLRDMVLDLSELRTLIESAPQLQRLELHDVGFVADWQVHQPPRDNPLHHDHLREVIIRHPTLRQDAPVVAALLSALHLPSLSLVQLDLMPSDATVSGEMEALVRGLEPTTICVTRLIQSAETLRPQAVDKIWTVEFGPVIFTFSQLAAGRVLGALLKKAAPKIQVWEADEAFLRQFVRRGNNRALPSMPYFEKIVLVVEDEGPEPPLELAEEALAACLKARDMSSARS